MIFLIPRLDAKGQEKGMHAFWSHEVVNFGATKNGDPRNHSRNEPTETMEPCGRPGKHHPGVVLVMRTPSERAPSGQHTLEHAYELRATYKQSLHNGPREFSLALFTPASRLYDQVEHMPCPRTSRPTDRMHRSMRPCFARTRRLKFISGSTQ